MNKSTIYFWGVPIYFLLMKINFKGYKKVKYKKIEVFNKSISEI